MLAVKGSFREIFLLYLIAMALSLLLAYPPPPEVPPEGKDPATAGVFFGYLLLATAVFILLIKFFPWLFRHVLFALELFFLFLTTAVISTSLGLPGTLPFLAVIVRVIWRRSVLVQNASTVTIISVATAAVGSSLAPTVAVILLAVLSLYDCVSVFVTKHMVVLARALGAGEEKNGKGRNVHLLGGGDIAIPGILAVSLLRVSPAAAAAAALGACIGLVLTARLVERWKRVLPALPTIALAELLMTAAALTLSLSP